MNQALVRAAESGLLSAGLGTPLADIGEGTIEASGLAPDGERYLLRLHVHTGPARHDPLSARSYVSAMFRVQALLMQGEIA